MKKSEALLGCSLLISAMLIPAMGMAQESGSQSPAESSAQQDESASGSDAMEKDQKEEAQDDSMEQQAADASSGGTFMTEQAGDQIRSDQLIGSDIVNRSEESIGKIDELLLNQEGQVVGIIVGVGGFLGMGEKHVALAWEAVEITRGEEGSGTYQVRATVDKAALENAEAFKTEEKQQAEQQAEQQLQQLDEQAQQPQE